MLSRVTSTLSRRALRHSGRTSTPASLQQPCSVGSGVRSFFTSSSGKAGTKANKQLGLFGSAALALGAAICAGGVTAYNPARADAPAPATAGAFKKSEWTAYPLMDKVKLNHNTTLLRFKLPEGATAGITVASMLSVGFRPPGEEAKQNETVTARPYTPTSRTHDTGFIEFVIKAYPAPGGVGEWLPGVSIDSISSVSRL